MEREASKTKSAMANAKPVVTSSQGKTLDNAKSVLLFYKISWKNAREIVGFLRDALNQAKPPGCVYVENDNVVDLSPENEIQNVKDQTLQWVMQPNRVVLLCLGEDGLSHEGFLDENGKLHCKIFPVCFGNLPPSDWPEAYCLGVEDPEKLERSNELEGEGLDRLVGAIRGAEVKSGLH